MSVTVYYTITCPQCCCRAAVKDCLLATATCQACGSPLSPSTPERLAKEALDRSLSPSPTPKTHKRDTRPTTPRTNMKRLLRGLKDQK